ncbi:site-specific integrase [Streptomyces sp. t39]|uniref:site-specific integrase n=1 Tax=Streptomyces sp. t39 TaxID=1828156 RepID=UPI0011CE2DA0|nr:site-specific integrase [Streptomyces sp. t39]TXS51636.1 site-specific integrase [Streptomyces sp. t39]
MSYRYASVRGVAAAVERVAPKDPQAWEGREPIRGAGGLPVLVSDVRARQLWALVGMYDRAVGSVPEAVLSRKSPRRLFEDEQLEAFWQLAVAGDLRRWEKDHGKPLPLASKQVLRTSLGVVADLVVPGGSVLLPVLNRVELKPTVDPRAQAALYRRLVSAAGDGPLEREGLHLTVADRSRLLAMVAVVLDTGCRSGELAALRMGDLADGLVAVRVRRRGQRPVDRVDEIAALAEVHRSSVEAVLAGRLEARSEATRRRVEAAVAALPPLPEVSWYGLREGTRVAVQRWLETRDGLVDALPLEGGRSALWVTLQASKAGPAGITIRAQGLRMAYARGVEALNWIMAGEFGWEPLPTTMEQLRRAVDVEPLADVLAGVDGQGVGASVVAS